MIPNKRLQHRRAKREGDEVAVFVKEQTGNVFENPVVSTASIAEEFEMDEAEVVQRLRESDLIMGKEVEESVWVWW